MTKKKDKKSTSNQSLLTYKKKYILNKNKNKFQKQSELTIKKIQR